jgi:CheY-like chemotaxis protein
MQTGTHILVVDDEPDFLDPTVELLTLEGFRVTGAPSGPDALHHLAQVDFPRVDIFLIDYRMPGLNGGETWARIRAAGIHGCAILVSAAADIERLAQQFGFHDLVRKPCDLEELLAAIGRCSHSMRAKAEQPAP